MVTSTAVDPAAVRAAAGAVPDPEMPAVSLAQLGVLHDVEVADGRVVVELLPTYVGCPATELMAADVEAAVSDLPGVTEVEVHFRHDPPWTPERITDDGRAALASFGIAPPDRATLPVVTARPTRTCPYCGSTDTQQDSIFGPTPCRDTHFCNACTQPFEAVRR